MSTMTTTKYRHVCQSRNEELMKDMALNKPSLMASLRRSLTSLALRTGFLHFPLTNVGLVRAMNSLATRRAARPASIKHNPLKRMRLRRLFDHSSMKKCEQFNFKEHKLKKIIRINEDIEMRFLHWRSNVCVLESVLRWLASRRDTSRYFMAHQGDVLPSPHRPLVALRAYLEK